MDVRACLVVVCDYCGWCLIMRGDYVVRCFVIMLAGAIDYVCDYVCGM